MGLWRTSPTPGVVARNLRKYLLLPTKRPFSTGEKSVLYSWFGQGFLTVPVLCDRRSPSPRQSARHLETTVGRREGSEDPRRTKQTPNKSSRDQRTVKTNFGACQPAPLAHVCLAFAEVDFLGLPSPP